MKNLKLFFDLSAIIPWPFLVINYDSLILTSIMLGFQLFCLFAGIYLEKIESE